MDRLTSVVSVRNQSYGVAPIPEMFGPADSRESEEAFYRISRVVEMALPVGGPGGTPLFQPLHKRTRLAFHTWLKTNSAY